MTITVTQQDIDAGVPSDECHCPVARAVRRDAKLGDIRLRVNRVIEIEGFQDRCMSQCVAKFVKRFDDGWPVSPFTFDLPLETTV